MRLITYNYASQAQTDIIASEQNSYYPALNIKNPHRSKEWRSVSSSANVVFDLKTTDEINSVVLLWDKGGYRLSDNAVVRVQANATNNWSSPAVNEVLTFNDKFEIMSHYFSENKSYRYWRIVIDDPLNVYGYVSIGVVVLGKSEQIENNDNGFEYQIVDQSVIQRNSFGNEYADIYPTVSNLKLDFNILSYDSSKTLAESFNRVGSRNNVFVVLDHTDTVFSKDHFAIWGKFDSSLTQKHIHYKYFSGSLNIRETL